MRAVTAWAAAALNAAGVAPLGPIEGAYRPDQLSTWVRATLANPERATLSAALFTGGLLLLAAWAGAFERRHTDVWVVLGARLIAGGAMLNAAGTWSPAVLAGPMADSPGASIAGVALLGLSLFLDATFNACLAVGLLFIAWGLDASRNVRAAVAVAALLVAPVAGQAWYPWSADWLVIGGPAWLGAVLLLGVQDWRDRGPDAH